MQISAPGDEFVEPSLKFRIAKPPHWNFVPPAWSPSVQLANMAAAEFEWLRYANQPFVCFMNVHDSDNHVYPTVQVTARPFGVPSGAQARELLEQQQQFLKKTFNDVVITDATSDRIVAGYRANSVVAQYRLRAEHGRSQKWFRVVVRSLVIFSPGLAFTVGMSSSTDPRYASEREFSAVVESIRVG